MDALGSYLIADKYNHRAQLCPADSPGSDCAAVAGRGGEGSGPRQLNWPFGVALDARGNYLIVDAWNHRVQLCPADSPGSDCTTVAGTGGEGSGPRQLNWPSGRVGAQAGNGPAWSWHGSPPQQPPTGEI